MTKQQTRGIIKIQKKERELFKMANYKKQNKVENETIETIKKMPKADGWGKLPTIGDIKGMNDFGGKW